MLERIIHFSIRQRIFVMFATLGLIGLGVYNFQRLPIDALPDITNVQVQINTSVKALPPQEVERLVTFPIEWSMGGIPKVEQVRSRERHVQRRAATDVPVAFTASSGLGGKIFANAQTPQFCEPAWYGPVCPMQDLV